MKRQRGFTLVEVMVVVLIIGILSGLALAYGSNTYEDEMLREATQFAMTIEDAHRESMTRTVWTWNPYNLQFRYKENAYQWCLYRCSYMDSTLYPKSQVFTFNNIKIAKVLYYPHLEGLNKTPNVSVSSTWRNLYFRSDGSCGPWGVFNFPTGITFYLQHLKDPNLKYRVVVMPLTGKTKIIEGWQ